ncbi:F-box/kelch-repeat protein At3g23880-like [Vicia villosa]|uniref:F-box/kelch-repeat protein At3g23880-like n=1 Tax=Vicia villosa TaxID=3911 RepID=UPI00273A9940|nr:F-box/kelch-repeat protein At3g23880-like [Vicia villosa]
MNPSPIILPDDLIAELLSFLPVKYLLQFKCVCNSWKILISDSAFVKLHLKRSATQNPMLALIMYHVKINPRESPYSNDYEYEQSYSVVPYLSRSLLDNSSFTLFDQPYCYVKNKGCSNVVGSCNGLILLAGDSFTGLQRDYWFRLWNPATKTTSKIFGKFYDFQYQRWPFVLGFDDSTDTYKVVVSRYIKDQLKTEVRVLSFSDDVWRNIESFPGVRLNWNYGEHSFYVGVFSGVYLSGTINWLASHNNIDYNSHIIRNKTVEDYVIVSLDLRTEMYNQYLLPQVSDEVPPTKPTIGVLGGCLCLSHSLRKTDFVIWRMKKFGVEDSWTQFLKISYHNLQIDYDNFSYCQKRHFQLIPLLLFEDRDTLMLSSNLESQAFLYNWKDNRVQRIKVTANITRDYLYWDSVKDYVESLVPIH